ncbi:MAG: hypothetical protein Q9167_004372 [Letrouitia subvulpina]
MAVAGYLMFGESVREEITSNIVLTKGYPRAITIVIVVFIAIIPLTKLPLNARPVIRSIDGFLGVDPAKVPFSPRFVGLSGLSRGLLRIAIRILTMVVMLLIAIVFPSFDTIMALMGSVLCFGICIIFPLALYLKIFGHRISRKERIMGWFLMIVSAVLALLGTVWALIPRRIIEPKAALGSFELQDYDVEAQDSIKDAFAAVQSSEAAFAVVPFENSTFGTVVFTLDLLLDRESNYSDLVVCGESYLEVCQCLVGHPSPDGGSEGHWSAAGQRQANLNLKRSSRMMKEVKHIYTVYSHPAAFGQCEQFLSTYLAGVVREEVSSTSRAAEIIAREPSCRAAAISSSLAAEMHGLKLLVEGIQDRSDNSTRFFILKNVRSTFEVPAALKRAPREDGESRWKSLISFQLPQEPSGALADALQVFKTHGVNLTSINSRPSLKQSWHYVFLIEVQGRRELDGLGTMNAALEELGRRTKGWKWLGSWVDRAEAQLAR